MTIRFDDAAANEAVSQLEVTAGSLREIEAMLGRDLRFAVEDFHGRFRHSFDHESARHTVLIRALATDLHLRAVAIRARQYEAMAALRAEWLAAEEEMRSTDEAPA